MKKYLTSVALASVLACGSFASEFALDMPHTSVEFSAKHMMVSKTKGVFKVFDAQIDYDESTNEFKSFRASVDTASIDTGNATRDNHLKAPDFLNASKNPKITFVMDKYVKKSDDEGKMHGTLNVNGVSKAVVFDVDIGGVASIGGKTKLGFELDLDIKRKDYGVGMDTSDSMVGDKIDIKIYAEANKINQ